MTQAEINLTLGKLGLAAGDAEDEAKQEALHSNETQVRYYKGKAEGLREAARIVRQGLQA